DEDKMFFCSKDQDMIDKSRRETRKQVFNGNAGYIQNVMDQVLSCIQRKKRLSQVAAQEETKVNKVIAVLVTVHRLIKMVHDDLYSQIPCCFLRTCCRSMFGQTCSERFYLKDKLSKQAISIGEIKVYQPSGERYQQIEEKIHDQKALTEMYLLSLTDNVVTSTRSTSGYNHGYCISQAMPSLLICRVFDPRLLNLVTLLLLPKDVMQNGELTRGRLSKTQVNTHKNNQ
ncbi:hypothetical protein HID58_052968, partial [Brassica napus]